ncbi:hypothetical protein [Streptosporangium sp. NPDC051022]|uniref:hypothetical protein n=1 Tax=Streptosporangium sp. NPDC051022 TaxID=3155752 RepID=UPI00344A10B9
MAQLPNDDFPAVPHSQHSHHDHDHGCAESTAGGRHTDHEHEDLEAHDDHCCGDDTAVTDR